MTTSHDFAHLPVHELLRRFAALRADGDDRMSAVWEALVITTFDRVEQSVRLFRFPSGPPLREHLRDDAVQEAYLRLQDMADGFEGTTEGAYYAALHRCVWYACMDLGRDELRHERRSRGSLDEPAFEDSDRGRFDDALEAAAGRRDADARDKLERELRAQRDHDLVQWGVAQVGNDGYREMLELTVFEKLDGETIAARLDITTTNVYQRRRRALQKLEEVLRDRRP
jgi:RNA polymerase sigma factor (sigma-70 family)